MVTKYTENNCLVLAGKITSEKKFSHEIYGESFYVFNLEVPRLSGNADTIPVTISERIISGFDLSLGKNVAIEGQFRSYNSYETERNRLVLTVFAKEIKEVVEENLDTEYAEEKRAEKPEEETSNQVVLKGYVCKKPIYRQTPFGREISDVLLAVNRAYNKSDYIPCIAWGRNARFCENMPVGTEVKISGRVQSRTYEKKLGEEVVEKRVAYEVSVGSLEVVDKEKEQEEILEENKAEAI